VSKNAQGVVAVKEQVLAKLRRTANVSTTPKYKSAITVLNDWHVWKTNLPLRNWFQETWLAEHEVSFWVFRQLLLATTSKNVRKIKFDIRCKSNRHESFRPDEEFHF